MIQPIFFDMTLTAASNSRQNGFLYGVLQRSLCSLSTRVEVYRLLFKSMVRMQRLVDNSESRPGTYELRNL